MYTCSQVSDKEWSGPMFFKVEGDPFDEKADFTLKAHDMYIMDIGSGATTEFEHISKDDERLLNLYIDNPELMDYRLASIHSHNSMKAFMSGTDMEELKDGAKASDMYLMLVVNNDLADSWVAKLGIAAKVEKHITSKYTLYDGRTISRTKEEKSDTLMSYDIKVVVESDATIKEEVDSQLKAIKDLEEKRKKDWVPATRRGYHNDPWQRDIWEDDPIDNWYRNKEKNKVKELEINFFSTKEILNIFDDESVTTIMVSDIIKSNIDYIRASLSDAEDEWEAYVDAITANLELMYIDKFHTPPTDNEIVEMLEQITKFIFESTNETRTLIAEIKDTIKTLKYVENGTE